MFWSKSAAHLSVLFPSYRIGPFEVESALIEHPAVVEAAVVSSPDPTRGEVKKKNSSPLYNLLAVYFSYFSAVH